MGLRCPSNSIPGGPVLLPQLAGPPQCSLVNNWSSVHRSRSGAWLWRGVSVGPAPVSLPSVVPSRLLFPSPWGEGVPFSLVQLRRLGPREGQWGALADVRGRSLIRLEAQSSSHSQASILCRNAQRRTVPVPASRHQNGPPCASGLWPPSHMV